MSPKHGVHTVNPALEALQREHSEIYFNKQNTCSKYENQQSKS